MKTGFITLLLTLIGYGNIAAYNDKTAQHDSTTIDKETNLQGITVTSHQSVRRMAGAINGSVITQAELFRAACCNLGESFSTNPSVDVSYSDAATGAKQIKLLGLSGTYVQMMTETLPDFRGAALPFSLDYVPGPWIKSIQVSKGTSTVKNSSESITGQINIEYKKPDDVEQLNANVYGDTKSRYEANFDGNIHLSDKLSTVLLLHGENDWGSHDDNGDGFMDKPNRRQINVMNRWKLAAGRYLFHGGIQLLSEKREGGQTTHHVQDTPHDDQHSPYHNQLYAISLRTNRYAAYMKHAFILNPERNSNIAIMANASLHQTDARYGYKAYNIDQSDFYTQLMYETDLAPYHNLSIGTNIDYNHAKEYDSENSVKGDLTTLGFYAQHTYNLRERITAMIGLRADHHSEFGWDFIPRLHLKWMPADLLTLRATAGRGLRTVRPLAEMHYLLGSGRTLNILSPSVNVHHYMQEAAWNFGLSAALNIPIAKKTLRLNAEYYYTTFQKQVVIDYESDPTEIRITSLDGRSYSHTLQIDASYPLFRGFTLTAAYRLNDVWQTIDNQLRERPLTSKYKGLLTASYKNPLETWQFDATLQLNGGGRIVGDERFKGYEQVSAQITREFRRFAVYVGGENLTNFRQLDPIRNAASPFDPAFESTLVWGPVHGRMFYAGIRLHLEKF